MPGRSTEVLDIELPQQQPPERPVHLQADRLASRGSKRTYTRAPRYSERTSGGSDSSSWNTCARWSRPAGRAGPPRSGRRPPCPAPRSAICADAPGTSRRMRGQHGAGIPAGQHHLDAAGVLAHQGDVVLQQRHPCGQLRGLHHIPDQLALGDETTGQVVGVGHDEAAIGRTAEHQAADPLAARLQVGLARR
jgi:hypothetical protein